ncbi:cell wall-binding repeat-containing protein [Diaminobutyricibacter sp. McL0618]|uniref:cell wall-binding repeat-containing protein n=1 Tax=Leifsonia sp. McL0618 TaxID=3415677 RepID=UPI003CF21BDD
MHYSHTRLAALATTVVVAGGIAFAAAAPATAAIDATVDSYVSSIANSETAANYNTWHLSSDPAVSAATVDGAGLELQPGTKGTTVIKGLDTTLDKAGFEAVLAQGISWTSTSGHANFQIPIYAEGQHFVTIVPMAGVVIGVNQVGDAQQWAFSRPINGIPAWENHTLSDLLTAAGAYTVLGFGVQDDPGANATVSSITWGHQVVHFWNPAVNRVSGSDRFDTSVQVSKNAFPHTAPVVFVATGTGFADALAAAAPAAQLGGPLLLSAPDSLPAIVKAEIQRLNPSKIYIVGGTGAVSAAVEKQLDSLAPTVKRLAGSDRFVTARAVIDVAFPSFSKAYVATGMNFPDALSAAAAAGAAHIPVLLLNGSLPSVDAATTGFLTSHGANTFTVVGGPGAVSAGVATGLGPNVTRIQGSDRFETSRLLNADAFKTAKSAYFATGNDFADALSGAVLAATNGAPLYVVTPACLPAASKLDLANRGVENDTLIGGTGVLSDAVANLEGC